MPTLPAFDPIAFLVYRKFSELKLLRLNKVLNKPINPDTEERIKELEIQADEYRTELRAKKGNAAQNFNWYGCKGLRL